jgi:ATP-dependent DNA helicase RecG
MFPCLDQSVTTMKGIGPAREQELAAQGIHTLKDILLVFPRRFNLRRSPGPMPALEEGEAGAASGVVEKSLVSGRGRRRNLRVMVGEAAEGESGSQVELVLFGRGYLKSSFKKGGRPGGPRSG